MQANKKREIRNDQKLLTCNSHKRIQKIKMLVLGDAEFY